MQGSLMLDLQGHWLSAAERAILRQPQVCGVMLFARNVASRQQVSQLCRSIRAVRPDLLIAVDQEGGRVQRLRRGFSRLPCMRAIAESDAAVENARLIGWLMASEVQAVGIDFSFAPVLDLDYGHNQVIGDRAFSGQPEQVIELGASFMRGMHQAGMATVGKHFPGHGWVDADSHFALPVDNRDLATIESKDLRVFASLGQQMTAVMPAHVIYPVVDEHPAGFSSVWLQQILRHQLGFGGLMFSEDLSMAGAHVAGDIQARTRAAFAAGCDIALVCNDRGAAEQALICMQQDAVAPCAAVAKMAGKSLWRQDFCESVFYQRARQLASALTA